MNLQKYATRLDPIWVQRAMKNPIPWGPLGYVTFKRTYARLREDLGRTEEFGEMLERGVNALLEYGMRMTNEEAQLLYEYMYQLKCGFAGRMCWQLGTPTVAKIGGNSLCNCFSGDTKFFADGRVVQFADVVGETVNVLTADGQNLPAEVKYYGEQQLYRVKLKVVGRSKMTLEYRVTADHRWILEDGTVTTTLMIGDRIKAVPHNTDMSEDTRAFCHGLVFGDGTKSTRYPDRHTIQLCGDKRNFLDKFKSIPEFRTVSYAANGDPIVQLVVAGENWKSVPVEGVSSEYIRSFVAGWYAADGNQKSKQNRLFTQDRDAANWLVEHAGLGGYLVTGWAEYNEDTNFGPRSSPLICVGLRYESAKYEVVSIETDEVEPVYCVEEPVTKSFTLAGGIPTGNCYYISVKNTEAFCFTFDMLMLGGGVGFGITPSDVFSLPKVQGPVKVVRRDGNDVDFIVPDNREGWVELLRRVLNAYFVTGRSFTYSTHCVRGKGERIKGFGGVASGPGDLVKGIGQICGVLDERVGKKIRPVDALDIMNIIGSIVVSGNVRRSAQIAIGSPKDSDYLEAKMWANGNIPNWRGNSNNTVLANDMNELTPLFWEGYTPDEYGNAKGENYGLFNLELSRKYGRLIDGPNYRPDPRVEGPNPCAEQSLEDGECCDLAEQYLPNLRDRQEFVTSSNLMYKVCKTVLQLPFAWDKTQEVVQRNQRMGVGVSGFCQARHFDKDDYTSAYQSMEKLDEEYSREIKSNRSIKLSTVKPSGTVSLLAGVTPGVHPAFSRYYIRRIRFSAEDPIVEACRRNGYRIEPKYEFDGTPDHSTQIVEFPIDVGPDTLTASQVSAVKQLEMQEFLQTYWSDNAVSVTVYYRDEELPEVKEKLNATYKDRVKTTSFLRHSNHGFKQAPYEEISAEMYREMASKCKPVTSLNDAQQWDIVDSLECAGGACPVK